jgi:hypothetical protein
MPMQCVKYMQLSQHYGAALRRWSQAESSSNKSELSRAARRLNQEIEMKAGGEKRSLCTDAVSSFSTFLSKGEFLEYAGEDRQSNSGIRVMNFIVGYP